MSLTPVTREQLAGLCAKRLQEQYKKNVEAICSKIYYAVISYADNSSDIKSYTIRVISHSFADKEYGKMNDCFYLMIRDYHDAQQSTIAFAMSAMDDILQRLGELFVDCPITYAPPTYNDEGSIIIDWS